MKIKQSITSYAECVGTLCGNGSKGAVELVGMGYRYGLQLQSERPGVRLQTWELEVKERIRRIEEESDTDALR